MEKKLRILQVNSFFYNRGGAFTHMDNTSKLLEEKGHEVLFFAMQSPQDINSPYRKYWPSHIDFREAIARKNIKDTINVLKRTLYSFETQKYMDKFLDKFKPDVVHIHNFLHHLSPSILKPIKKRNIPIVWTIHDYTALCPNTSFITDDGEVCEACKTHKFFMAPVKKCKKHSFAASFIAMCENYLHRFMRVYKNIDTFISPSDFLRNKFIDYGFNKNIVTVNNFLDTSKINPCYEDKGYILYAGRLEGYKGIDILLSAVKKLDGVKLKIAGDGTYRDQMLKDMPDNVEYLGQLDKKTLEKVICGASFIIVPSIWYENFPYSILEPMAYGKAVIGSRIGGIPEQIVDADTGYLFDPANTDILKKLIMDLINNKDKSIQMGKNARNRIEKEYNPSIYYEKLMNVYNEVIDRVLKK